MGNRVDELLKEVEIIGERMEHSIHNIEEGIDNHMKVIQIVKDFNSEETEEFNNKFRGSEIIQRIEKKFDALRTLIG